MHKNTKKGIITSFALAGLGLIGKTVYDYHKEAPEQSKQSWLLERVFHLFTMPLKKFESKTLYKVGIKLLGVLNDGYAQVPDLGKIEVSEWLINDMQTIVLNNKREANQEVIYFLHGGAHLILPAWPHFYTIADIIRQTDAKVVMPIYPKAPSYDFTDAYPKIVAAYRQLLTQTSSSKNVSFLGDSAGGGLALGLSHLLAKEDLPQPKQLILLSPWLDASLENPHIKKFEESDAALPSQKYIQAAGRLWANNKEDVYHPLVSPMYSKEISDLPPITLFVGSDELLYPDIMRFKEYVLEKDKDITVHIGENMVHNYPIFNTPEGAEARCLISKLI